MRPLALLLLVLWSPSPAPAQAGGDTVFIGGLSIPYRELRAHSGTPEEPKP
jgi:hypothetical protein